MPDVPAPRHAPYRLASTLVFLVGLSQGLLPLVLRLAFDHDRRFAVALELPAPWWWLACLAIVVGAAALLEVIERAERRPARP
jgi:hypothetical protein